MNHPGANISVNVDITNPGQFFACCGLLELADRLWPGAEGWFTPDDRAFLISCDGTLSNILDALRQCEFSSSLGSDGLKRLGTLLSAAKSSLTQDDQADKDRLHAMWQVEQVTLSHPFNILLDWWWNDSHGTTLLKTWAAKQFVMAIMEPLLEAIRSMDLTNGNLSNCLTQTAALSGLPFYFDAENNAQTTGRDYGFSTFRASLSSDIIHRPLLELLAFIGLQRFRPQREGSSETLLYSVWTAPLRPVVAAAATGGNVCFRDDLTFCFRMLRRTKYMKAFLPATPL